MNSQLIILVMSQFVYRAPPFEFAKLDENILSLIVTLLELFICIAPPYLPIFSLNSLLIIDTLLFTPSKYIPPPPSSYELCTILLSGRKTLILEIYIPIIYLI